jgi:hypothetical protein
MVIARDYGVEVRGPQILLGLILYAFTFTFCILGVLLVQPCISMRKLDIRALKHKCPKFLLHHFALGSMSMMVCWQWTRANASASHVAIDDRSEQSTNEMNGELQFILNCVIVM